MGMDNLQRYGTRTKRREMPLLLASAAVLSAITFACVFGIYRIHERQLIDEQLIKSIERNDDVAVSCLLSSGADAPGSSDQSLFRIASRYRIFHFLISSTLIQGKYDPLGTYLSAQSVTSDYPYRLVFLPENSKLVRALLVAGADPNGCNADGDFNLIAAVDEGKISTAKLLLDFGANPNAISTFTRQSALMYAVQLSRPDMVSELLARGADKRYRTAAGETARSEAKKWRVGKEITDQL